MSEFMEIRMQREVNYAGKILYLINELEIKQMSQTWLRKMIELCIGYPDM